MSSEGPVSQTHRVQGLVLAAVQLLAVVEDVVVGGVETGLDTVSHHLTGPRRGLQFLDLTTRGRQRAQHGVLLSIANTSGFAFACTTVTGTVLLPKGKITLLGRKEVVLCGEAHLHPKESDAGQEVHSRLEVLEAFLIAGREVVLENGG